MKNKTKLIFASVIAGILPIVPRYVYQYGIQDSAIKEIPAEYKKEFVKSRIEYWDSLNSFKKIGTFGAQIANWNNYYKLEKEEESGK